MSNGWVQNVIAEVCLKGATAQMVQSHLDSGANVTLRECEIMMLRWRIWPNRLNVFAWQSGLSPRRAGQLMFFPPDVETGAMTDHGADNRSLSLRIDNDWFEEVSGTSSQNLAPEPEACLDFRDLNIEHAMRRMTAELLTPSPYSKIVIESCSASVVADLALRFAHGKINWQHSRDTLSDKRIRHIEEFILNYDNGVPTLTEIANDLDLTVGYLRKIYRNTTGRTLFSLIEELRLERARGLLADSNVPLKVVAHRLGYCTASAFSFAFRKVTGVTPRQYRLAHH